MQQVRALVVLVALFFVVKPILAQNPDAPATSSGRNTFLRRATHAAGQVVVKITGQWVAAPTDTFLLQKQVFTGSTDCSTGAGAVSYVAKVSASSPHAIALTSSDSVRLQAFPSSDRNGQLQGFQNPDGATIAYLPGNAVCVAGFNDVTRNILAQYTPGVQVLEWTCTTPKNYFNPGDPVCVRVTGTAATGGTPWKVWIGGGSINQCFSFAALPQVNITSQTQTANFLLPANNATIPAGCTSNGTTDIRGNWVVNLLDQGNNTRGQDQFRMNSSSQVADLNVYMSVNEPNGTGGGNFPPAGGIKFSTSVGNSGPDPARNATFVQTVPASTTFQSFTQTVGPAFTCSGPTGGNVTCTRPSLAPDTYANFEMLVSYSGQSNGALLTSDATASSASTELYAPNNTSSGSATITTNTNVGQFICRPDITVFSTSASGAVVNYTPPPVYSTISPYTGGIFATTPASGSLFPIGTTYIAVNAGASGSGQCVFKVDVRDGQRPDLTVVKTHTGVNFVRGQSGAKYTITVSNIGGIATIGAVTVTDTLPPGVVASGLSGTGWSCSVGTMTCVRADALAAGASYPPIIVTVNLMRYLALSNPFTNKATVSGGGEGIIDNNISEDTAGLISPSPRFPKADFNGDAKSDVIWRKSTTGENAMWLMNGTTISSPVLLPSVVGASWKMSGVGDFNGDSKADVVWMNEATGQVVVWLMNGTILSSATTVTTIATSWRIAGVGDFNGDGNSDLFWRNQISGQTAVYLMNGASIAGGTSLNTIADMNWAVVGIGDFNADGTDDVFWRHAVSGQNVMWFLADGVIRAALPTTTVANVNNKVAGVGDANGDAIADVFWWNQATGDVVLWIMNGTDIASSGLIATVSDLTWRVEAVGNFDGDGKADLMWRKNNTGQVVVWLMFGLALKQPASTVTTVPDLNWTMVAPR